MSHASCFVIVAPGRSRALLPTAGLVVASRLETPSPGTPAPARRPSRADGACANRAPDFHAARRPRPAARRAVPPSRYGRSFFARLGQSRALLPTARLIVAARLETPSPGTPARSRRASRADGACADCAPDFHAARHTRSASRRAVRLSLYAYRRTAIDCHARVINLSVRDARSPPNVPHRTPGLPSCAPPSLLPLSCFCWAPPSAPRLACSAVQA